MLNLAYFSSSRENVCFVIFYLFLRPSPRENAESEDLSLWTSWMFLWSILSRFSSLGLARFFRTCSWNHKEREISRITFAFKIRDRDEKGIKWKYR